MMKLTQIMTVLSLLVLNISNSKVQSATDKSRYEKVETKDFIAYFPKTQFEIENQNDQETTNGKGSVNVWTLSGANGNNPFIYQVSQSVLTQEMMAEIEKNPNTLNVICNGTMMSFASKLGGEEFQFSPLKEKGLQGMTSTCKVFDGKGTINSKAFRVNNYLYMISAGGKEIDLKMVQEFLQSFKIKR